VVKNMTKIEQDSLEHSQIILDGGEE